MRRARQTAPLLRRLRRRRGLTQADMAEALDVDIRTFERLASGRTRLDLDRIVQLAQALDCDPVGLAAALALEAPAVAYACADAKVLLTLALSLQHLTSREIDILSQRAAVDVIAACDRLVGDLLAEDRLETRA